MGFPTTRPMEDKKPDQETDPPRANPGPLPSPPPESKQVGRGENPYPFSNEVGPHGTSRNSKRLRGVIEVFQIRQDLVEAQVDVPNNIFTNKPVGPVFFNSAAH